MTSSKSNFRHQNQHLNDEYDRTSLPQAPSSRNRQNKPQIITDSALFSYRSQPPRSIQEQIQQPFKPQQVVEFSKPAISAPSNFTESNFSKERQYQNSQKPLEGRFSRITFAELELTEFQVAQRNFAPFILIFFKLQSQNKGEHISALNSLERKAQPEQEQKQKELEQQKREQEKNQKEQEQKQIDQEQNQRDQEQNQREQAHKQRDQEQKQAEKERDAQKSREEELKQHQEQIQRHAAEKREQEPKQLEIDNIKIQMQKKEEQKQSENDSKQAKQQKLEATVNRNLSLVLLLYISISGNRQEAQS